MKKCRVCKNVWDDAQFHRRPDSPDGLRNECKPCHKNRNAKYRQNNLEKDATAKAAYYQKHRDKMLAANAQWRVDHPEKMREYKRSWKIRNPESVKEWQWSPEEKRDYALRTKYGMTLAGWHELCATQNGSCAICKRHQTEFSKGLHVDHDHVSGRVRGLLCGPCNSSLGLMQEDPSRLEAALAYLRRSKEMALGGTES